MTTSATFLQNMTTTNASSNASSSARVTTTSLIPPGPLIYINPTSELRASNDASGLVIQVSDEMQNDAADVVIGTVTLLLVIIGILGNISSFLYFWPRRSKSIYPLLYAIICVIDVCTSIASIPVIASLFSSRSPIMFASFGVCVLWSVVFHFVLKMSMFLVMPLSITRTLAVTCPYYKIKRLAVIKSMVCYAVFILLVDIVYIGTGWSRVRYREQETSCEFIKKVDSSDAHLVTAHIYSIILSVEMLVPAVIITTSFVVGVVVLVRGQQKRSYPRSSVVSTVSRGSTGSTAAGFRRATYTVATFTAVFLICNLPCFIVKTLYFVSHFEKYEEELKPVRKNVYFRWYGHLLSHVFLTVLNAAINPCLYLLRMSQYRLWTSNTIFNIPLSLLQTTFKGMKGKRNTGNEYKCITTQGSIRSEFSAGTRLSVPSVGTGTVSAAGIRTNTTTSKTTIFSDF